MINIEIKTSKQCNGEYSLFVSFNYNETIVSIIKSFPTRAYDKTNKTWELPFNQLGNLVNSLSEYDITITGKYIKLETHEKQIPNNFKFKTKPFEHQLEGIKYGLNHDKWLLGDEQGLGKTKQVIDIANIKNVKHCLIICCVNGLKWNWQNEVRTHSNEDAWILGQRTNRNNKIVIGDNPDRLDDLMHIDELPRFIITNIETLRYKVKTGRKIQVRVKGKLKEVDEYRYPITERLQELCSMGEIVMIAADEVHKCFDYDTEITTNLGKLKIGDIVINKTHCSVLSYNEQANELEWKPITNWFANEVKTPMIELTIQRENGEIKTLKCTLNHKIYTSNRGWVSASDLTKDDDIVENLAFM